MCIFTGPVGQVSATRIFARVEGQSQIIVYELNLDTHTDVAMVLPMPVAEPGQDELATFISLASYRDFFKNIDRLFPSTHFDSGPWGLDAPFGAITVHSVGAFHASYLPSIAAFSRLDRRFHLSPGIWEAFPQYADYGFVVFQLKSGNAKIHPMAFSFPTRDPSRVFFPTTHVHDSEVHAIADFDHFLYTQTIDQPDSSWISAPGSGALIPGLLTPRGRDQSGGLIDQALPLHRRRIEGKYDNEDIWVTN